MIAQVGIEILEQGEACDSDEDWGIQVGTGCWMEVHCAATLVGAAGGTASLLRRRRVEPYFTLLKCDTLFFTRGAGARRCSCCAGAC